MENSFQTSFIPKKPIISNPNDKEPRSLLLIISTSLLAVSILASGLLFVYKIYLVKKVEDASRSLLLTRDSFEKDTISELELFDKRTQSAKQILSNHLVFSPMFELLGSITIPSVQYTNFTQQQTGDKKQIVTMRGLASDYRSIALQADVFNSEKGRAFSNVLFSNLIKNKDNNIAFELQFNIEPDILSHERNVAIEQKNSSVSGEPIVPESEVSPLQGVLENKTQ